MQSLPASSCMPIPALLLAPELFLQYSNLRLELAIQLLVVVEKRRVPHVFQLKMLLNGGRIFAYLINTSFLNQGKIYQYEILPKNLTARFLGFVT